MATAENAAANLMIDKRLPPLTPGDARAACYVEGKAGVQSLSVLCAGTDKAGRNNAAAAGREKGEGVATPALF